MTVWTVWLLVIMVHTSGGSALFLTITSSSLLVKHTEGLDGIATVDVTDPENPKLYTRVNVPGHPRAVRTFRVPADAPLKNRNGDVVGIGDFALVTSGYWANEEYAWLSLVGLSDPKAPYSLGDMRIAKNTADYPYPDDGLLGRVYEAPGHPLDVAAVGAAGAYVAVLGMGLQGYKMEMLPRVYENGVPVPGYQQLGGGMAMEPSYRGLGSVGDKLLNEVPNRQETSTFP